MKSVKLMVFSNILYFDKEILLTTVCTNIFNFSKFSLCFMSKTNADVMVPRSTFFTTYPKYHRITALIDDAVRWLARLIFLIVILLILDTCMLREHIIDGALFGLLLFLGVDLVFSLGRFLSFCDDLEPICWWKVYHILDNRIQLREMLFFCRQWNIALWRSFPVLDLKL